MKLNDSTDYNTLIREREILFTPYSVSHKKVKFINLLVNVLQL